MSEIPWSPEPPERRGEQASPPRPRDPFGIEAYLARQREQFASGPTMVEILADLDRYRRTDGPTNTDIVEALHEGREERDERMDAAWDS